MIKVGSDFSGVGAFNFALKRNNIECDEIFACDMDKFARQTFIENHGCPKYFPFNVYDREIPNESLDIYMTSPPCQSFSIMGKRLGKDDKRGILFFNSLEFIKKNKPRYFIFENVQGLLIDDDGKTFQEWVNLLGGKSVNGDTLLFPQDDSIPYHIHWQLMNSKKYGVPQHRERVFIIGIRDDADNNFRFPKEQYLTKTIHDCLDDDVDEKYFLSQKMVQYVSQSGTKTFRIKVDFVTEKTKIAKPITTKPDQRCGTTNYIKMNGRIRRLTPRESFRLMDFPESFQWSVSDAQAYKQAGNSIVVSVLEKIIANLKLT